MRVKSHLKSTLGSVLGGLFSSVLVVSMASAQSIEISSDGKAIAYTPKLSAVNNFTASQIKNAESRLPLLDDISQLRNFGLFQKSGSEVTHQAFGRSPAIPFTTRTVALRPNSGGVVTPVDSAPYRQTGKLVMRFGASTGSCTGSVIRPGLVLTAAHCVHDFGDGRRGFADQVTFQPARHNGAKPYGDWKVDKIIVPKSYFNGSDRCLPEAPGVVCENDLAILVMKSKVNKKGTKQEVGDVVGTYGIYSNDRGYTKLGGNGGLSAHLTQLGYPGVKFTGVRMLQTESVAIQDASFATDSRKNFNQVIIGTNMTGGSSGGPWLHNFGRDDDFRGKPAKFDDRNRVAAVTSWGFRSESVKLQGASRFGHNKSFPPNGKTNIGTLIDMGCKAGRAKC